MPPKTLDVAVVGGGPAGMSAGLVAGRCGLDAVIVNAERPRNRVTRASHGFLTRDGARPLDLLRLAKEDLGRYPTVAYRTDDAVDVVDEGEAFLLRLASGGVVRARRLILAAGHRDELERLGLPGVDQVYGTSVFPCPFCDAFEHGGERLAVFGADGVERYAALVKVWSDDVAVFTNGRALQRREKDALTRNGVRVHESKVLALESEDGRLLAVTTEEGSVPRDAGFLWDRAGVPATTLADDLGVRRADNARGVVTYEADEAGRTSLPRVYVVGDLRTGFSKLMPAASEGARCVEHIVHEIADERWR